MVKVPRDYILDVLDEWHEANQPIPSDLNGIANGIANIPHKFKKFNKPNKTNKRKKNDIHTEQTEQEVIE